MKVSPKTEEIAGITIMVLMLQLPLFYVNDGVICKAELFYMITTAFMLGIFVTHFLRKE